VDLQTLPKNYWDIIFKIKFKSLSFFFSPMDFKLLRAIFYFVNFNLKRKRKILLQIRAVSQVFKLDLEENIFLYF
jgi:hypothetical protein